jgi:hypothetical protein
MDIDTKVTDKTKFITFGCWNYLNDTTDTDDNLTKVTNLLKIYIAEEGHEDKTEFIVISGDNYYPEKIQSDGGKNKIIFPDKLTEGFNKLPQNIEIDMIMGNHDYETNTKGNLYIDNISEDSREQNDCKIVKLEVNNTTTPPNNNISLNFFKSKYIPHSKTLILMIDTNIYLSDKEEFLKCFNVFFKEKNMVEDFNSALDLQTYQNRLIMDSINVISFGGIQNIIIIGHHPITGIKYKKKKNKKTGKEEEKIDTLNDIPEFIEVLNNIYNMVENINYYYLCADYHSYQTGQIVVQYETNTFTINQYIAGIGGTSLDHEIVPQHMHKQYIINDSKYNITYTPYQNIRDWGFLVCRIKNEGVEFEPQFINVSTDDEKKIGGGKKKSNFVRCKKISKKNIRNSKKRKTKQKQQKTKKNKFKFKF